MRLVNIHTLKLHEFFEGSIPPYAILSHRWTDEELTFKDLAKGRANVESKGYIKLLGACRVAADYHVNYVWIDTCCIDKRSSAELSESINSMFTWYRKAEVCLAYLEDVYKGPDVEESFKKSVWFTRAWTLQELLAPDQVEFFDNHWTRFCGKATHAEVLEHITGIEMSVLDGSLTVFKCSVADRMSWASRRDATRKEDIAYSLLGIFDINMPLLYGEGAKAFKRLQQEILRNSTNDLTILCWGIDQHDGSDGRLLASSPSDFGSRERLRLLSKHHRERQINVTNLGLELHVDAVRWDVQTWGIVVATRFHPTETTRDYILLIRRGPFTENLYVRTGIAKNYSMFISQRTYHVSWGSDGDEPFKRFRDDLQHAFMIRPQDDIVITPIRSSCDSRVVRLNSEGSHARYGVLCDLGDARFPSIATLMCRIGEGRTFYLYLTFDFDAFPCCLISPSDQYSWREVWNITGESDSYVRHEVVPIHEEDKETCWFLRSRSDHPRGGFTWARLPAELTGTERPAWVALLPPSWDLESFGVDDRKVPLWWVFGISSDKAWLLETLRSDVRVENEITSMLNDEGGD